MVTIPVGGPFERVEDLIVTAAAQWELPASGDLFLPSVVTRVLTRTWEPVLGLSLEAFRVVLFSRLSVFPVDITGLEESGPGGEAGLFAGTYVFSFSFPDGIAPGMWNFAITVDQLVRPFIHTGQIVIPVMKPF
jgi:hypothetical protein